MFSLFLAGPESTDRGIWMVVICAFVFGTLVYFAQALKRIIPKTYFLVSILISASIFFGALVASILIVFPMFREFVRQTNPNTQVITVTEFATSENFYRIIGISFVGVVFVTLVELLSQKLGPGVMFNWIIGRYYKPRVEERVFMFLDMRDSTRLAEELGNLRFSSLVQDFIRDLTEPVRRNQAEVSHYIGDEAVISWKLKKAISNDHCVMLFFDFLEVIEQRSAYYSSRYGVVPTFKAAVHYGEVVTTEVGEIKSEIVFHGDVLNTTARIEGLCNDLDQELLISSDLKEKLSLKAFVLQDFGSISLKGKRQEVGVWGVALLPSIDR